MVIGSLAAILGGRVTTVTTHRQRGESSSPLAAQPHPERDHDRPCERKPGDSVMHVVVLEVDFQLAGFWNTVRRHRQFHIDKARHDFFPATPPSPARITPRQPHPAAPILPP